MDERPRRIVFTEYLASLVAERDAARQERDDLQRRESLALAQLGKAERERDAAIEDAKTNADAAVWSLRERDEAREGWREAVQWLKRLGAPMSYWEKEYPWLFEEE